MLLSCPENTESFRLFFPTLETEVLAFAAASG
jgi:hypothetical protein